MLALAGCTMLPNDGPSARTISAAGEDDLARKYLVVDVSTEVVGTLSRFQPELFSKRFAAARPAPGQIVGVGDILAVILFEGGQGGLFASDQGSRVALTIAVDSNGMISIPYAGAIKAAGRSTEEVEKAIVAGLEGKAIQPQALVTVAQNVANTVIVNGDVGKPGRYPLTAGGDRVLDAVAAAGGSRFQAYETQIQLVRGGKSGAVLMKRLVDNPAENVYLRPGDKLFLIRSPLSFTVFGSAKKTGSIPFDIENMSLIEAVGRAGGLNDLRADVKGLFVFRYETDATARALVPGYDGHFGAAVPVVYRVNMDNPDAYFFANSFRVHDKDVLYISSAPGAQLLKFFQIINGVNGIAATALTVERVGNNN